MEAFLPETQESRDTSTSSSFIKKLLTRLVKIQLNNIREDHLLYRGSMHLSVALKAILQLGLEVYKAKMTYLQATRGDMDSKPLPKEQLLTPSGGADHYCIN
jgi:hypothetical protein